MAKGVGGGTLTKTKAAAATPKKRSTTTAAKPVKKLSKVAATTKPVKRLSKAEQAKIRHLEYIAKLIEEKKNGKKFSKAGEWMIAHPNGLEGTYDMRAVMK